MMAYCPICGTDHSPDILCSDKASDVLRHAGIRVGRKLSVRQFRDASKKARKSVIIWFLILGGSMALAIIFFGILR